MEKFNNDRELEKKTQAIIDYFKLVYIEKLTKDKNIDAFKMLDGENLLNKVIDNNENSLISLNHTNFNFITDLKSKLEEVNSIKISSSLAYSFSNLGWLEELITELKADETGYDTIFENAPTEVFDNIFSKDFTMNIKYSKERIMINKVKELLKSTK